MPDFATVIVSALSAICFYLFLPGILINLWLCRGRIFAFSEAFFWGWLFLVSSVCVLIPFASSTKILASLVSIIILLFAVCCFIVWLRQAVLGEMFKRFYYSIRAISSSHVALFIITLLLFTSFVSTHNLGFDDTFHLSYLLQSVHNTPFHTFIPLSKYLAVQLANYPFFGAVLGIIASGTDGSVIFVYYTTGFFVLFFFIVTCYNSIESRCSNRFQSFSIISLIFFFLIFIGWDNYFNFCIYPLQQAKLLFLTGLSFILLYFFLDSSFTSQLFLGFSLCTAAVLHHANLIILYVLLVILVFFVIIVTRRYPRRIWLLLAVPILSLSAGLYPGKGFVRFDYQPLSRISKTQEKVDKPVAIPRNFQAKTHTQKNTEEKKLEKEDVGTKIKKIIKYFHKLRLRLKRVLTLEMLFIPIIILTSPLLFQTTVLNYVSLLFSSIAVFYLCVTTIPRQALISLYYSSPFWMVYDIYSSRNVFISQHRYLSDPYTALYLKLTLNLESCALDPVSEVLFFSPLFKPGTEKLAASLKKFSPSDKTVLNLRYWGLSSLSRVPQKVGRYSSSGAQLNIKGDRQDLFNSVGFFSEMKSLIRQRIKGGLFISEIPVRSETDSVCDISKYLVDERSDFSFYNDAAVVRIRDLQPEAEQRLTVRFHGDWLRYFPLPSKTVIPEPALLSGNHVSRKWDPGLSGKSTYGVSSKEPVKESFLLFRISGQGFISGLGFIKSVALESAVSTE